MGAGLNGYTLGSTDIWETSRGLAIVSYGQGYTSLRFEKSLLCHDCGTLQFTFVNRHGGTTCLHCDGKG